ncbi:hypothetical protein ACFL4W_01710 [Planctomycetota bacterium]
MSPIPLYEYFPIGVVFEQLTALNPPHHDVVQCARVVDTCFAWHENNLNTQ